MRSVFVAVAVAVSALAQSVNIAIPAAGQTLQAGSNITVAVVKPVSQLLTSFLRHFANSLPLFVGHTNWFYWRRYRHYPPPLFAEPLWKCRRNPRKHPLCRRVQPTALKRWCWKWWTTWELYCSNPCRLPVWTCCPERAALGTHRSKSPNTRSNVDCSWYWWLWLLGWAIFLQRDRQCDCKHRLSGRERRALMRQSEANLLSMNLYW